MTAEDELVSDIAEFSSDPDGFARFAWDWDKGELAGSKGPRAWQSDVFGIIQNHLSNPDTRFTPCQIAVSSGHGIGKSALISMVMAWAMSTCENTRVIVTANTEDQLRTKTWPEITKWFKRSINAHWWDIQTTKIAAVEKGNDGWRVDRVTWSDNNTEAFAGLHNQGYRLVIIKDEASTISDNIWEVTQGALTDENTEIIWIAFGNPTRNTGRFRECFGRFKHRWHTRQIDSRTVEGTNKELISQWVQDYGEDSDYVRVRVKGEFPRAGSTQFIPGDIVAMCRRFNATGYEHLPKVIVCDVARFGDDQTVIGMRQGPKLTILAKYRGLDTVQVSGRLIEFIERERPRSVVVDGDGIGGGVVDQVRATLTMLKERARTLPDVQRYDLLLKGLVEFHGGGSPVDGHMYYNRRAEVWGMARDWLKSDADIPDDPELEQDLTGPEYFFSSKNQIQLERKEDMKKRGLASPDSGDMLAMSFAGVMPAKTHEELMEERINAAPDEMQKHLLRLAETERRKKANKPLDYWNQ